MRQRQLFIASCLTALFISPVATRGHSFLGSLRDDLGLGRGILGAGLGGLGFGDNGFHLDVGRFHLHVGGFGGIGGGAIFDFVETRFEDKFATLQTKYDDGVANTTDYYSTSDYTDLLGDVQKLSDRHSVFIDRVQTTSDWLGTSINYLNDEKSNLEDLLAKYQADTSLSAARLERLTNWITTAEDRIMLRVDTLTQKQTALDAKLATYTAFGTTISDYLATITTAGGGTTPSAASVSSVASLTAAQPAQAVASSWTSVASQTVCELVSSGGATPSIGAVPEPAAWGLAVLSLLAAASRATKRLTQS